MLVRVNNTHVKVITLYRSFKTCTGLRRMGCERTFFVGAWAWVHRNVVQRPHKGPIFDSEHFVEELGDGKNGNADRDGVPCVNEPINKA
jgi:hypothetical protein